MKEGYKYFLITTAVVTAQFIVAIFCSQILGIMDLGGWMFYLSSCVSHAACLAIVPAILYFIFLLFRMRKTGYAIWIVFSTILSCVLLIDMQVYQLYRFHINGFVLNMLLGPAASEIFNFDFMLYIKCICIIAFFVVVYFLLGKKIKLPQHRVYLPIVLILICTLFAHTYHIYAAFYAKPSVKQSERLLPYYFPTTSYSLMTKTFGLDPVQHDIEDLSKANGEMIYPKHEIQIAPTDSARKNILIILIDSWNPRSLTAECMPNVYDYAMKNQWYQNHISCSNGTKSGVFGLWYSIPSYYWDIAESDHVVPSVLDVARQENYVFHNYPSASHIDPPFAKVLFAKEKNLRVKTEGETSFDRDEQITNDVINDLKEWKEGDAPFLSFLFYDLPHSFQYKDEYARFTPTWKYADYSKLGNGIDATPFWNLYRNTCYATDLHIARVLSTLKECELEKNTVVIITGDHSQEFNENHKNYWGHNGNFSKAQIQVPFIIHIPFEESSIYNHRTTHYDVMPTIMKKIMGVTNPLSDFSVGHLLSDTQNRNWHFVGSELNYGFIIQGDTIVEKEPTGAMSVYDEKMNIVTDYKLNAGDFSKALESLYYFLK